MIELTEPLAPMCEISFRETESGKCIHVRLWPPSFDKKNGRYYCVSEMEGLEEGARERLYSDDPFGALMLSLLRFSIILGRQEGDFRTKYRDAPHMYFPKRIPWDYGSDVYQRLCKMVDDEVQKIEDERTRRREAGEKRHGM